MTYIDAYHDRENDIIHVVERIDGEHVETQHKPTFIFYWPHDQGAYTSIFGDKCHREIDHNHDRFKRKLFKKRAELIDRGVRPERAIFESDINPVFRFLAKHYTEPTLPVLNVGFFDIEVDFNPDRGYAPVEDPFAAVTAISLLTSENGRLATLALRPPTVSPEQVAKLVADIPHLEVFDDETELHCRFLELIQDVSILSGWNCIAQTEGVWLRDRITPLGRLDTSAHTHRFGSVLATHDSGPKRARRLVLEDGSHIVLSDEHVIPVRYKRPDAYTSMPVLLRSVQDQRVDEIRTAMEDGTQAYVEVHLRRNDNPDLSWRVFLLDYLRNLLALDWFDLAVSDDAEKERIHAVAHNLGRASSHGLIGPLSRISASSWCSKRLGDLVSMRDHLKTAKTITLAFSHNRQFECVDLDASIPCDVLHVLGLQFTDGTFDRKRNCSTLYGKNAELMAFARRVVLAYAPPYRGTKELATSPRDGVMSVDWKRGSYLGMLLPMIYDEHWNKHLDLEMLSRLSAAQFRAFFSGLVDGDGCVSNEVIQFCNYQGQLSKVQQLLRWNGVYASITEHNLVVSPTPFNREFVEGLTLRHSARAARLETIVYARQRNAPSKKLKRMIFGHMALVRVRAIEDMGVDVPMGDIQTEHSYFVCGGMRVHNSEQFDIPYLINRIRKVLGDDAVTLFCRWGVQPKQREYEKFGKKFQTYELIGRPHLDYLLLYQKHNTQQQHSYRLDFIGEIETGETKVPYEGTLDTLYRYDFPKFIAYNRQDTALLGKIDAKRKFIDLANQIAHANKVTLKTTMGSVALIEQAIMNEMHEMGFIVPDRKPRDGAVESDADDDEPELLDDADDEESSFEEKVAAKRFSLRALKDTGRIPVVGAYVATPVVGLHDHIAACDINSLYPSAIRALNMSPETVFGQVRPDATKALIQQRIGGGTPRAEAWEGLFALIEVTKMHERDATFMLTVDWEDPDMGSDTMSAADLFAMIFHPDSNLLITANGTIFRTDKEGMIPHLLGKWYAERKSLQKQAKEWSAKAKAAKEAGDEAAYKEASFQATFYDRAQLAAKIRLNSLYGALLNEACRFADERLGQSTTLTGRSIVRHMSAKVNEAITGEYDHAGAAIKYGDTDSVYFSAVSMKDDPRFDGFDWSRESLIALYDGVAETVNDSFPEFMDRNFNTGLERGGIIKAGRELVASKTLFIKKKKYACLIYDLEGQRQDVGDKPGKLKVMGLDLKRADTPKFMQEFLQRLLMGVLTNVPTTEMYGWIAEFREAFKARPGWEKGTPRKVNGLTMYGGQAAKASQITIGAGITVGGGKVQMPGHVRASLNWNKLCSVFGDRAAQRITDGQKIIVCKLKPSSLKMDSVAYPIDEPHLPVWFKELPFDDSAMEKTIIDAKLLNLVGVLNWDLTKTRVDDDISAFMI